MDKINDQLLDFIARSPTAFHAAETICTMLDAAGFQALREKDVWAIRPGGRYYTVRNGSSVIAFRVGEEQGELCFRIAAAHGDSPMFKIKSSPVLSGLEGYVRLNVEAYGGMIDSTWLDRPLGIAGRVFVKTEQGARARLFASESDVVLIPNLAFHFNREVNSGYAFNRQVDLCPLFSAGACGAAGFDAFLADGLGVAPEDILSRDLFVVNRQRGLVWGAAEEFLSAPRLDDLQCAFAALKGFLASRPACGISVYCCFDNEEVGSRTRQGALSTFLKDSLTRLSAVLGCSMEEYQRAVASSFLLSADNAHAVHPNHPEKTDAENRCFLNQGIVLKENASQKYTTDALSRAIVKEICSRAGENVQLFANRSDLAGGSTLGNLSNAQVSLHAADVGLPQLAMHSCFETAGARDTASAVNVFTEYYSCDLQIDEAEGFTIR